MFHYSFVSPISGWLDFPKEARDSQGVQIISYEDACPRDSYVYLYSLIDSHTLR